MNTSEGKTDESIPTSDWYAATGVSLPDRAALNYDLDVDVCVVGGGLAGLTVAREVARRGWSVAVLEAGRIAAGASSRNGGLVAPGFSEQLMRIVDRVGLERAKVLFALSMEGVDYVSRAIRETGMPGVDVTSGWLSVWRYAAREQAIAQATMLADDFGVEVEVWSADQVRESVRSALYHDGVYQPGAFHIHPLNYALGLAADAQKMGAHIFEQTPAIAIDPAGLRKRIDTPEARVRANHVVFAAGAQLGDVFRYASETIIRLAAQVAITAPLGERLLDVVRFTGAISEERRGGAFFRIIGTDRLMWTGGWTTRQSEPRPPFAAMRREMVRAFPQLRDVEIAQAWSGSLAYAVHRMPQIGEIAPGLWLAGGFGAHGLNTTAMAGDLIARALVEGDDRWRLFSSYELVWAGGWLGRISAQGAVWATRLAEAGKEWRARTGERIERRRAEKAAKLAATAATAAARLEAFQAAEEHSRALAEQAAAARAAEDAALAAPADKPDIPMANPKSG